MEVRVSVLSPTRVGTKRSVAVPSPSWPNAFHPVSQQGGRLVESACSAANGLPWNAMQAFSRRLTPAECSPIRAQSTGVPVTTMDGGVQVASRNWGENVAGISRAVT